MLGNRRYCYPLTITDFASRYLLTCEALSTTQEHFAFTAFDRAFKEFGLPRAIRTDNGVPFAGPTALYRLSKLAVWWLRLGIQIERIQPGHPAAKRPARAHASDAEAGSDQARRRECPPAAGPLRRLRRPATTRSARIRRLGMKVPADLYARSARVYRGTRGPRRTRFTTPTLTVTQCGRICFNGRKINLSHVFAGQNVGVTQVGERIWLVTFMHYDLGYFDDETCRLEPIENPFGPKVLPMCSE